MNEEIKIYILEKRKNGRNRYLISAHNQSVLFDLEFFNGTRKQVFNQAEKMRDRLILLYNNKHLYSNNEKIKR